MKYHFFKNANDEQLDNMAKELGEFIDFCGDKLGISVFANFGTLLGIVRGDGFIPGDHDVDLCYLSKKTDSKDVLAEIADIYSVFRRYGILGKNLGPGQCSIFWSEETRIDFFTTWIDHNGDFWTCQWGKMGNADHFFPLRMQYLRNELIPVPDNAEIILTKLYGADWMTPKQEHPKKYLKRKNYLLCN